MLLICSHSYCYSPTLWRSHRTTLQQHTKWLRRKLSHVRYNQNLSLCDQQARKDLCYVSNRKHTRSSQEEDGDNEKHAVFLSSFALLYHRTSPLMVALHRRNRMGGARSKGIQSYRSEAIWSWVCFGSHVKLVIRLLMERHRCSVWWWSTDPYSVRGVKCAVWVNTR